MSIKTFIEPGIKKDDVVLGFLIPDSTKPQIAFYHSDYLCRASLNDYGGKIITYIIKYTPERAKMTTQELYDTVVQPQELPLYKCCISGCSGKIYTRKAGIRQGAGFISVCADCKCEGPTKETRDESLRAYRNAFKSIKVVEDGK
jgi:hypothetical protein